MEGLEVILFNKIVFLSLKIDLVNSADSGEMLHNAAFDLGFHRFQMYPSGSSGLQSVKQQSRKTFFYKKPISIFQTYI